MRVRSGTGTIHDAFPCRVKRAQRNWSIRSYSALYYQTTASILNIHRVVSRSLGVSLAAVFVLLAFRLLLFCCSVKTTKSVPTNACYPCTGIRPYCRHLYRIFNTTVFVQSTLLLWRQTARHGTARRPFQFSLLKIEARLKLIKYRY